MSQYPLVGGGTPITDAFLAAMLPNYVIKPADAPGRTAATLVADPDMTFNVEANAIYLARMVVRFGALTAAGLRTSWTVPSGTTGNRECIGPGSANATESSANTTEMRWSVHGYGTAVLYTDPRNSTTLQSFIEERALIVTAGTAGAVTLNWGQSTANATGTVVAANSWIEYRRIG